MASLTNYIAFDASNAATSGVSRIGHYDQASDTVQPLSFVSGTPISNLYQVIEAGEHNIVAARGEEPLALSKIKILPPIDGRDILAVGKNYSEHAKEFNQSGYDSSDKVDQPSCPVIFTKRATSIIATGEEIYPHAQFTQTADYEGEIGVIIGKPGYRITEADAWNHVWGYTIVNDMTARERQRDHKQFFIGKSPDTYCPIGPLAVPASHLPKKLQVQTHVNGELRQDGTTDDLIFPIPTLIKTISEGQTLQPGDVIATGTPAGVGIGKNPPVFLKPGDEIAVTVTGLGTLRNRIASPSATNATVNKIQTQSHIPLTNATKAINGAGLTDIGGKLLHYKHQGLSDGPPAVFVHGLGGTLDYWTPLIQANKLAETHSLHLFDLEGHGLSPTSPLSALSISSFAQDVNAVIQHANLSSGITLFAHSMGCLVALAFVLANPGKVSKLILVGPPPSPLPDAASQGSYARAATVRAQGMSAVVDAVATAGTSENTKKANHVALTAVRLSLLGQDPEGYAKACAALAGATNALDIGKVDAETLIITGDEDKVSPPTLCEKLNSTIARCSVQILSQTGHWHVYENLEGVSQAVRGFL